MANLRWKLITIAIVLVVFTALGVYPIVAERYGIRSPGWLMDKQLKLGLDLKGGVQLVLRLRTDDALRIETEGERTEERVQVHAPSSVIASAAKQSSSIVSLSFFLLVEFRGATH